MTPTEKKKISIETFLGSKPRLKILRELALKPDLTIADLMKKTKLDQTKATYHLNYLENIGLLQSRKFGRSNKYRYNEFIPKARTLKEFIVMWEKDSK